MSTHDNEDFIKMRKLLESKEGGTVVEKEQSFHNTIEPQEIMVEKGSKIEDRRRLNLNQA